jgi:hypothetical protein
MSGEGLFPKQTGDKIFAKDVENLRRVVPLIATTYTLSPAQTGGYVSVNGVVSIPAVVGTFQPGDIITIFNRSAGAVAINIPPGPPTPPNPPVSVLMAATNSQPAFLTPNALVTFLCVEISPVFRFIVIGAGVS